ncbi:SRPBCC family protein [Natrinema gelatinilyticum]|uniref:SRPBCC family protein n=1 Tax=Natrinema gelatinilyticum TaxID=2961571 RepID=UPI0020C3A5B5|nr:SRPBCC domain-containing protein [Natrinema gelatinilyticum]
MSNTYTATASTTIDVPPRTVWDALTAPELIKQYFFGSTIETDWEVGSPIVFRGEWEGETYEDKGEIQRFEPERVLEYTHWSPLSGKPDVPESYHTVTWELTGRDDETDVTLTQDNNDTEEARAHSEENWEMVLSNLKELLES